MAHPARNLEAAGLKDRPRVPGRVPAKRSAKKAAPKPKKAPVKKAARKAAKPAAKRAPKARPKATKAKATPPAEAAEAPKPKAKERKYPGESTRMQVPIAEYERQKDAFKAPLKELGLKWQYLGPGQGRYHDEKVNVFAKFGDNVDYSVRGDPALVARIVAVWRGLGAKDVTKEAKAEEEAEDVKAWRLREPQRRPGEPDGFFKRRVAEWEAEDPRKAKST